MGIKSECYNLNVSIEKSFMFTNLESSRKLLVHFSFTKPRLPNNFRWGMKQRKQSKGVTTCPSLSFFFNSLKALPSCLRAPLSRFPRLDTKNSLELEKRGTWNRKKKAMSFAFRYFYKLFKISCGLPASSFLSAPFHVISPALPTTS